MGAGKSTIAELLAKKCHLPFKDLDEMIEKHEQMAINFIFEKKGELYFRKTEHKFLKELIHSSESFILSLGGGTPCYANNHELLKSDSIVSVYLKVAIDELCNRLIKEKSNRPLIAKMNSHEIKDFVAKHLFERSYYYNQATHTLNATGKSTREIVAEIESYLV